MEYRVACTRRPYRVGADDARALRDPDSGELTAVRTSTHDVSEQRAREAQLRATTAELQAATAQTAAIAELGEHALSEADLECFLADATAKVAEILDVPLCAVLVTTASGGGLRMRAGTGWRAGTVGRSIVDRAGAAGWLRRLGGHRLCSASRPPHASWRRLLREHGVGQQHVGRARGSSTGRSACSPCTAACSERSATTIGCSWSRSPISCATRSLVTAPRTRLVTTPCMTR